MTNPFDPTELQDHWQKTIEQMNDQFSAAFERNLEAQTEFMEAWQTSVEEATQEDNVTEAMEGYRRAYETWMDAVEETLEDLTSEDAEDLSITHFRDIWLNAANESFKEMMGTSAFAAATGQSVEEALDFRQHVDELTEDSLHEVGLPTKGDIQEVGERLIELERRQHTVEQKLDDIIDALEDQ